MNDEVKGRYGVRLFATQQQFSVFIAWLISLGVQGDVLDLWARVED